MPVGRPDPDGDGVISASRTYRGRTLGEATVWDCPACGKRNEGRIPAQGCAHCGSGDQSKSRAGTPAAPAESATPPGRSDATRPTIHPIVRPSVGNPGEPLVVPSRPTAASTRVLRLIEYLILPGHNADNVLRRSLVGRVDFPWGTITASIVDSVDSTQEDRLRLAARQPGVWIANPTAMESAGVRPAPNESVSARVTRIMREQPPMPETPEVPDTGVPFTPELATIALGIFRMGGPKLAYTLALALQNIASEADTDPDRFLTESECLQLANALMQQIPPEWQQDQPPEAPPLGPPHASVSGNEAIERVRAGSVPTAVFREPKEQV